VDTVEEALNYTEGNEATNIDVGKLAVVLGVPLFHTLALFQGCVEFDDAYTIHYSRPLAGRDAVVLGYVGDFAATVWYVFWIAQQGPYLFCVEAGLVAG
jgi:hypothetical protein